MGASLQFDGMDTLRDALRKLPTELRDEARGIVEELVDRAETTIRTQYDRVARTGNLARGLYVDRQTAAFGVNIRIRSRAKHAWLYETGGRRGMRKTKRGANRGRLPAPNLFIPTAIATRKRIDAALIALLERAGFEVSG